MATQAREIRSSRSAVRFRDLEAPRGREPDLHALAASFVSPMRPIPVESLPQGRGWRFEMKLDGWRGIAVSFENTVRIYSKDGKDFGIRFSDVQKAVAKLKVKSVILDGEIIAIDESGAPSRGLLSSLQFKSNLKNILYCVFDILHLNGRDLRNLPLGERKKILARVVPSNGHGGVIRFLNSFTDGESLLTKVQISNLEGVVAKHVDSTYISGERHGGTWRKFRCAQTEIFSIGGYRARGGQLEALYVGTFVGGKFLYAGEVKYGFTPYSRRNLLGSLAVQKIKKCPFTNLQLAQVRGADNWVTPLKRVIIRFKGRTDKGTLAHSAYRRLITDL